MDSIKINTTQNVDLEYTPAGIGYRILATLLDGIFMVVYCVVIFIITGLAAEYTHMVRSGEIPWNLITVVLLALLPYFFYHLLCEVFLNGQSLGKKIMGIQVVKLDGTQPTFGAYFIRWILRLVDISLFNGVVALIAVAASEKSQRLGDMAAGTTVILKHGKRVSLHETILYNEIPGYKIVFPQVSLLSDKDMGIIKEVLDYCLSTHKYDALISLAKKTQTKMGVSSQLSAEHFLKTVLMDYSHYQFEK